MGLLFNDDISIKIITASSLDAITKINRYGIVLHYVDIIDDLTFACRIKNADYEKLFFLSEKNNWQVKKIRGFGLKQALDQILKRPVLAFGITFLLIAAFILPTKIFFVFVEGNDIVSDDVIVDVAKSRGLSFGANRAEVRNEKIKNILLDEIPQLEWAGVNTYGCVALITVQERTQAEQSENKKVVSHIISTQDGVISSMDVRSGEPLCTVGQAIKKGEKLVSGYTDCGIKIRAERSDGEIFANTTRVLKALSPMTTYKNVSKTDANANFSLIIGKKLINLSEGSGIYDSVCDKMYKKYTLTLPGGFELPVSLLYTYTYSKEPVETDPVFGEEMILNAVTDYLDKQMVAGTIRNSRVSIDHTEDCLIMNGTFFCTEMIGEEHYEEHYEKYG